MTDGTDHKSRALAILAESGVVSAGVLAKAGVPSYVLSRLVSEGKAERIGHGYYGDPNRAADLAETRTAAVSERLSMLAARANGRRLLPVVVLHTAAVVHGLTDDNRIPEIWLGVERGAHGMTRVAAGLPVRMVRMDTMLLCMDVDQIAFGGRTLSVTDRERTIVDLLRYTTVYRRNGLPLVAPDVAREALERGLGIGADPERIASIASGIGRAGWIPAVVEEQVRKTTGGYGF